MKENYQINLPYQFHLRAHSVDREPKLSHKKMKTMFLWNMSKSRRLTSTFFPIKGNYVSWQFDGVSDRQKKVVEQFDREIVLNDKVF